MNLIKKIKINEKIFAYMMVAVLMTALLPLYRLAMYSAPYWDDYEYSRFVHASFAEQGIKGIISSAIYTVKFTWYAWQGTYGSIFFMSLSPVAFGESYYFIGLWIIITCFSSAVFVLGYTFARLVGKTNVSKALTVASMLSLFMIELVYTAHQGFFWYNSAIHYTFMYGFMLFMFSAGIGTIYSTKKSSSVILLIIYYVLIIPVAGANFIASLQAGLLIAMLIVWAFVIKSRNRYYVIPALLLYAIGAYYNMAAPGNAHREAFYTGCGPVEAIYKSFIAGFEYFPEFTGWITIVMLFVFAPILWNVVIHTGYKYRLPLIITILSFCFYSTGFTPSLYGMGFPGLERSLNDVKWTLQVLIVLNETYWIGWLANKIKGNGRNVTEVSHNVIYYFGCLTLIGIIFATSNNQAGSFSSYGAYYYIHTGEANNYRAEYLARIELVSQSVGQDLEVKPHYFRPWLLCGKNELSTDPMADQNISFANFYGLNTVRIEDNN